MIGESFGRWTVKAYDRLRGTHHYYLCVCRCGAERSVARYSLIKSRSLSCGCHGAEQRSRANTRHGRAKTPEYQTWLGMKRRCSSPADAQYERYGGRGIAVCQGWQDDFAQFLRDMGPRPSPKHSLDRINNDGNYEPSNCRWATNHQQAQNRSSTKLTPADIERIFAMRAMGLPIAKIAEAVGVSSPHAGKILKGQKWA